MSMYDKLVAAGIKVSPKPEKIEYKNYNMTMKITNAFKFLNLIEEYNNRSNSAPDKNTFIMINNSIIINYERLCEAIKDILNDIAIKENITNISPNRGLRELIRHTASILKVSDSTLNAITKLTTRNEAVHDYINADYYDDKVLTDVTNDVLEYRTYLECIQAYLKNNSMIK